MKSNTNESLMLRNIVIVVFVLRTSTSIMQFDELTKFACFLIPSQFGIRVDGLFVIRSVMLLYFMQHAIFPACNVHVYVCYMH